MKRFTGHTEPWGTFLDVKHWKPIDNPHKYDGQRIVIGSVTDGYHPYEEDFCRTSILAAQPPSEGAYGAEQLDNFIRMTEQLINYYGFGMRQLYCFGTHDKTLGCEVE